ncbi:PREDICTED: uncharacterized protein LOC109333375 [Lupinus angustifolius]|uniref:uncharacterized protein LOC109333375 n=1 Tax=Lupinus angustifolius TaxID=3871 RepID=UPI00092E77FF|nr:PREDICTED: uncharacterized protein LOC109333375 [Lupinus angustifolius]
MEGIDYFNTFSHVVKITTVRVVLAVVAAKSWIIEQLDINNAFLHEDLHEEVYIKPPPGLILPNPNLVCKLNKSLYGLNQANDLVLTGNNLKEIQLVKTTLHQSFQIKYLGTLRYFLGLEVARSKQGIPLNQRKYTLSMLEESGCLASKPAENPFDPSIKLQLDQGSPFKDPSCYRRLVRKLIYLTISRSGISYAVQQLSLFMAKPMESHYNAAMRILRYLKSTPAQGLLFSSNNDLILTGFVDLDWQNTVSRSSTEAEYRALRSLVTKL